MSAQLPAGFTLDQPQAAGAELPPGFTLDAPAAPVAPANAPESRYSLSDLDPRKTIGEVGLAAGSGMVAAPVAGFAGLWGSVLPGPEGQGAHWVEKTREALTYEPKGQAAKDILGVMSLPGRAISAVGDVVGERGAEVSPALGTIGKTSVEALPLLIGARQATTKPKPLTPEQQKVAAARDAGFVMTPEEMGAGVAPRATAGIAGEARLARLASKKNQAVVDTKIKGDLGLPAKAPVDLDTLRGIRLKAGQVYDEVRNAGQVNASPQYAADLDALGQKYANVAKEFPELARTDVQAIIDGARKPAFSANAAVDLINQLRQSADDAFASRQAGLGKVYRGVSDALEAELGRHVAALGNPTLMQRFQSARTTIAKAYQAERALEGDSFNPRVYAKAAKAGKPLTGGAKEVGEFASRFERSSQKPTNQATGPSFADIIPATAGFFGMGLPGVMAFMARPAMRYLLTTRPAQALMDPRTRLSSAAAQGAAASQVVPRQEERP